MGSGGSRAGDSDAGSRRYNDEEDEYDSEMVDLLDVIGIASPDYCTTFTQLTR
jgi:hypothetical protein